MRVHAVRHVVGKKIACIHGLRSEGVNKIILKTDDFMRFITKQRQKNTDLMSCFWLHYLCRLFHFPSGNSNPWWIQLTGSWKYLGWWFWDVWFHSTALWKKVSCPRHTLSTNSTCSKTTVKNNVSEFWQLASWHHLALMVMGEITLHCTLVGRVYSSWMK